MSNASLQKAEAGSENPSQPASNVPLVVFRRSVLAEVPLVLLFLLLAAGAVLATMAYPGSIQWLGADDGILSIPIPLFGLIPILVFAVIIHNLFDDRYIIGETYLRAINGLLSLRKDDVRLGLNDIRGVEIHRSIYGRIVNIGDLKIGSAMSADYEVMILGVRDPSRYRNIILERKEVMTAALQDRNVD